jgi:hypothetical protein
MTALGVLIACSSTTHHCKNIIQRPIRKIGANFRCTPLGPRTRAVMSGVQIVLECATRGAQLVSRLRACTNFSMWCNGAEFKIIRRRTPDMAAPPATPTF